MSKKLQIAGFITSNVIAVAFGVIACIQTHINSKKQREELKLELRQTLLSDESQLVKETLADVEQLKKDNIAKESKKES